MIPLKDLLPGRSACLVEIGGDWAFRRRLMELGFLPGTWVRMVRTLGRDAMLVRDVANAVTSFAAAIVSLPSIDLLGGFAAFLIEGCRTTTPLEPLAGTMLGDQRAIAPGTVVTVQATIETNGRAILVGAPVLVGRNGEASSALVAPRFDDAG